MLVDLLECALIFCLERRLFWHALSHIIVYYLQYIYYLFLAFPSLELLTVVHWW